MFHETADSGFHPLWGVSIEVKFKFSFLNLFSFGLTLNFLFFVLQVISELTQAASVSFCKKM